MSSVRLLGVQLDDKLDFSLHVSNTCKSAANQLIRLNNFLCFERKSVLINSCFMLNFNCCPLVCMFSNATFLKKIENLQKIRALRFLYNNYQSIKKCKITQTKYSKNLESFDTVIKNWDGVNCKCVICKKL